MDSLCSATTKYAAAALAVYLLFFCTFPTSTEGYHALGPTGNITIKWDVMLWTPDGYVAIVTLSNFQQHRLIDAPGWSLSWTWSRNEVIWSILGSEVTEQGDCSMFKGNVPQSCKKTPTVVDLPPGTPYYKQVANCCKGGVLSSYGQNPATAVSQFQLSVGQAGTTRRTVRLPEHFTLKAPRSRYTCRHAKRVRPTKFVTPDKRRVTQALMTWKVTCTYSQQLR